MRLDHVEDSLRDLVTARDAAEDVDQHAANAGVREHDLERCLYDRFLGSAPDVQEVGGATARIAHRVKRRHDQARAVPDDPDVAIELDVAESEGAGFLLGFLVSRHLLELRELRESEERVVVDVQFRVAGKHRTVLLDEEGIDLDEGRVAFAVHPVEPPCDIGHGLALRGRDSGGEHQRARLERKQPQKGARPTARDRVRARRGHLLYIHTADGGEDHDGPAPIAVEGDPEVELACHVGSALHVHLVDAQSFYVHAQDRSGRGLRFGRGLRDLDPAGLAASACVHLRLHSDRCRDRFCRSLGFFR